MSTAAERSFTLEDQHAFAALSGDFNPIHVDPVAARRLLFGEPVVHGIHLVFWALETLAARQQGPLRLASVAARFRAPVLLSGPATLALEETVEGHEARVTFGGQEAARITLARAPETAQPRPWTPAPGEAAGSPRAPDPDAIPDARGSLRPELDTAAFARLFPAFSATADKGEVAALLAATRLVGMICPGLHSLFSELDLAFADDPSSAEPGSTAAGDAIGWETRYFHPDLRIVEIALAGAAASGRIGAFLRPEPIRQQTAAALALLVSGTPFADQRALVVGGSRGLGEVAAKLLAAGGADVTLTYARGAADAAAVVSEIEAAGGQARAMALDVTSDMAPQDPFSHVYYFASPKIRQGPRVGFDEALFTDYLAFFVTGFEALLRALPTPLTVLYPSTVFVETPEPRFDEYVAAKAAGEALCRCLSGRRADLAINVVRLPRLRTDQNAVIAGAPSADPVETMLGLLLPESP